MTDDQIKQQFEFQETYTKSLRALSLFPHVSNLDRTRTETFPDGTTIERSTREWAATLTTPDNSPALCDVVNGGPDQKANLLVPSPYYDHIKVQYKQYKTRLNPTTTREAHYRAGIPNLPDVIHITANVQSNLDFITNLANANVWKNTHESARNNNTPPATTETTQTNHHMQSQWPPQSTYNRNQKATSSTVTQTANRPASISSNLSNASEDHSTGGSTQSMTRASNTTYQARLHELEAILRKQQKVLDSSSKITSDRLSTIERQFKRFDDLDTKLTSLDAKIDHANHRQEMQSNKLQTMQTETQTQFKEMGVSLVKSTKSQSKLGGSMLDMQKKMDRITELMIKLNNRLDLETPQYTKSTNRDKDTNKVSDSPNQDKRPSNSLSLTNEQSRATNSLSSGSFTDTCYNSPQKKKVRSPDEETDDMNLSHNSETDEADDNTTINSETSRPNQPHTRSITNKRLHSQKETPKNLAAIFKKAAKPRAFKSIQALPNPQYTNQSDSDEADST
jgi:hypothetical protein